MIAGDVDHFRGETLAEIEPDPLKQAATSNLKNLLGMLFFQSGESLRQVKAKLLGILDQFLILENVKRVTAA